MKTNVKTLTLGSTPLRVLHHKVHPTDGIILIRVHADELAAQACGHWWLQKQGGEFIDIDNQTREVAFHIDGCRQVFDPNRIFSLQGIQKTLLENSTVLHEQAPLEILKLATHIQEAIAKANAVVALHNNIDFNITYYLPGGECYGSALDVFIHPDENPHNFVLVTQKQDFTQISKELINCVLLNVEITDHHGSLSDYCASQNIRYFNIETKQGSLAEQKKLLEVVMRQMDLLGSSL